MIVWTDEKGIHEVKVAIVAHVYDPQALAAHLAANGDHEGAAEILADGVTEWVDGWADSPEHAAEDLWATEPLPGLSYRAEEREIRP